ncbi:MAG: VanZ family protein [Anaerolineales bacterium]|jgi:VanZ family protein
MNRREIPLLLRWLPALILMAAIFFFSSLPASSLPYFGIWDVLVKKGGHMTGYAMLGTAYFFALPGSLRTGYRFVLALLMAFLFSLSDEFHQSFVQGRTSTLVDVGIDMVGTVIALAISSRYSSNSRSNSPD